MRRKWIFLLAAVCTFCGLEWLVGGRGGVQPRPGPMIHQDAYVWQRQWTAAVDRSIAQQVPGFRRLVALAAEISPAERWGVTLVHPDYAALRKNVGHIGLAVRIGPIPAGQADRVSAAQSSQAQLICTVVLGAVGDAQSSGLTVDEVQIDFDCAESRLIGYATWVRAVKQASAVPVRITALPSWLKHPEFAELAAAAGGYVLQVHSLLAPSGPDAAMMLCDPEEARAAVARAGEIGVPFRVALPTYRYVAGFSPQGNLLGLSAEGPAPDWPAGTTLRMMRSDPAAIAGLVREWLARPPKAMEGIIWYRLPISGDAMNWRPATLAAVMAGREPGANVIAEVRRTSPGLADVFLHNTGDADASLRCRVTARWPSGSQLVAAEGIDGFDRLDARGDGVTFQPGNPANPGRWIAPAEQIPIGWIRLSADREVQAHVTPIDPR